MALGTNIDSAKFVLIDRWGPVPQALEHAPFNAFDDAQHFNVATDIYPKGTIIIVPNDDSVGGLVGWSAFRYLLIGTQNPDVAIAVKHLLVPSSATDLYAVSNDPDNALVANGEDARAVAVALAAMTDGRYGFAYSGGVCPEGLLTDLDGNFLAQAGVVVGGPLAVSDADDPDRLCFKKGATAGYSDIGHSLVVSA